MEPVFLTIIIVSILTMKPLQKMQFFQAFAEFKSCIVFRLFNLLCIAQTDLALNATLRRFSYPYNFC